MLSLESKAAKLTASSSFMDTATADFYTRYARSLTVSPEARRSAMLPHVESSLCPGASVLDVGAGSGRDVAAMVEGGFDAFGVEPSSDMLAFACHAHPSLASRLAQASLPRLGRPFSERLPDGFDAVVCSAVLMHLEPGELAQALGWRQLPWPVDDNYRGRLRSEAGPVREAGLT